MTFLSWLLNFIGVAICTQIVPAGAEQHPAVVEGTVETQIEEQAQDLPAQSRVLRPIHLQKVHPSEEFKAARFFPMVEPDYSQGVVPFDSSGTAVELFNNVAVLDQGQHGTCVTFASTAALEMILNISDGISQQCTLELNLALGNNYWNGAYDAVQIIQPLQTYGAVRQHGCGGVQYPTPSKKISVSTYKKYVDPALDLSGVKYEYVANLTLDAVKAALSAGKYVAIGFGLLNNGNPVSIQGYDVVVDGVRHVGGLWACKQPSDKGNYCGQFTAGHEVVVIGYDEGQQLLKIRNSWGAKVGDAGNFYMTYEFYNAMVMDGTLVWVE